MTINNDNLIANERDHLCSKYYLSFEDLFILVRKSNDLKIKIISSNNY